MDQDKEMPMFSLNVRKLLVVTVAAAAIVCLAASRIVDAASPATTSTTIVTIVATGTFALSPVSGEDQLELSGNQFTIGIVGSPSAKPSQHGENWANFEPLQMGGTIYSGLDPGTAVPLSSKQAGIWQAIGASEDI